jgi:hypothetical protein
VLYWKIRRDEKEYGAEGQVASRFVMLKEPRKFWMFGTPTDWSTNTFKGKQIIWATGNDNNDRHACPLMLSSNVA